MRADLESRSFFNQCAAALDATSEEKDRAWSMMTKADVGRDDPTSIHFLVLAKFDGLASDLPRKVAVAGSRTVSETRMAIAQAVVEAMAAIPAEMKGQLESRFAELNASLATTMQAAIDRQARRRDMTRLGAAGLVGTAIAAAALFGGYQMGRDQMTTDAAAWAAIQTLPDGPKWLALARLNPSLDRTLAENCAADRERLVAGARVCDLPLALTAPAMPGAVPAGGVQTGGETVALSHPGWTERLGTWVLLGAGALLGLGLSLGLRRMRPRY